MADVLAKAHADSGIIELKGDFNLENSKAVAAAWEEQLAKNPATVAFDCRGLRFMDSSAIGILVKFLTTAMNRNIKLFLCDLNDTILRVFQNARLNSFFTIIPLEQYIREHAGKRCGGRR